jgi:lipocalin
MRFIQKTFLLITGTLLVAGSWVRASDASSGRTAPGAPFQGGHLVDKGDVGIDQLIGGRWMEVARTDVPSERGCSRVTMEFTADATGVVSVFVWGWDNDAGVWRSINVGAGEVVRLPWWLFWERPVQAQVRALRCLKGTNADGWIAIVGPDGVRVLSRSGGMELSAWQRCNAALRNAGQPVEGLIYFLTR